MKFEQKNDILVKAVYKVESAVIAQAKRVGLHKLPKLIQEYLARYGRM